MGREELLWRLREKSLPFSAGSDFRISTLQGTADSGGTEA